MFDSLSHHRSNLHAAEEKLKNARVALYEHENRAKPCEKCAMDTETGYGKAWHCDYYHTLQNRIEKYGREVDRCRAAVRDVEEKMRKDLKVGDPVVALRNILEGGGSPGNPNAVFPDPQYIHGAKGDHGEVIHIDQRGHCLLYTSDAADE